MDNTLVTIGQRIKAARLENKLSQAELAEKLSVSVPHVSDIERGRTNCGVMTFAAIAETLNVSADWLLNIDTPPSRHQRICDLDELLADCSPAETEIITKTLRALKAALAALREDD